LGNKKRRESDSRRDAQVLRYCGFSAVFPFVSLWFVLFRFFGASFWPPLFWAELPISPFWFFAERADYSQQKKKQGQKQSGNRWRLPDAG